MENILIKDCTVLPMTLEGERPYFTGSVGISHGRIAFASPDNALAERFETEHRDRLTLIDGRGMLAMPGLVNTHNHIPMTLLRSYADDLPLMPWLNDHIWPFEGRMTRDDVRVGAELGMAEMLLGGTTTSADMYWMDEAVAEAAEKAGIRTVISTSILDGRKEDFDRDFQLLVSKYAPGMHSRISLMVAPHAVYTCGLETLAYARDVAARYGIGLAIHVSETEDEQRMIRERYGKTPIEVMRELEMLNPQTLVVHAVHVSDSDIETMRRHGVSVAHNPQSNMKLSSGIAPAARMAAAGLNVSIGTDGPSSNNDLDMWEEMRTASLLQKASTLDPCVFPAYETLKMATVNGARALGLQGRVGQLREGMAADVILVDTEKPHLYPKTDMVANLVYCGKSSDVDTVIVDGRIVVRGRKLLTLDAGQVCREAQQRFEAIKSRL